MSKPSTDRKMRTAYHEAGHVVAAHVLGLGKDVKSVTIEPGIDYWGQVLRVGPRDFHPDVDGSPAVEYKVHCQIMVSLAGGVAESIFLGRRTIRGCRSDMDAAVDLALYVSGSSDKAAALIQWLRERIRGSLQHPWRWAMVQAIAAALLEHGILDGAKARELLRGVRPVKVRFGHHG